MLKINGEYTGQDWEIDDDVVVRCMDYLSALEGYIYSDKTKDEEIIKYIKGEVETLEL